MTGLVTLLKLTDLGLQTYVVNRLCGSHARGDIRYFLREFHSALRVQVHMAGVVMVLLGALLFLIPVDRLLGVHSISGTEFSAVAVLLSAELLIGVPMGLVAGVYRTTGRLARAGIIGAVQQFALLGATLVLIVAGSGFFPIATARVVIAVLCSAWILWDLRRLYPWLTFWPRSGTWSEGMRMIGPGLFFLLLPLADYVSSQWTLLVVQKACGGADVSRLATHRTMVNFAIMFSGLLTTAVWPELTTLHALDQKEKLTRILRSLTKLNLWWVSLASFGMLVMLPWVYPLWTARRLQPEVWTLAFLVARTVLWGIWSVGMTLLLAVNRHQPVALSLLASSMVTGVLTVLLVPTFGIPGAALALALGDLSVCCWVIPSLACREIGYGLGCYLREALTALVGGIGIPLGVWFSAWILLPSGFMLSAILICFGLSLGLMWGLMNPYERRLAFQVRSYLRGQALAQ